MSLLTTIGIPEAAQASDEIEIELDQFAQFFAQDLNIPARFEGELVVGQDEGAKLILVEMI